MSISETSRGVKDGGSADLGWMGALPEQEAVDRTIEAAGRSAVGTVQTGGHMAAWGSLVFRDGGGSGGSGAGSIGAGSIGSIGGGGGCGLVDCFRGRLRSLLAIRVAALDIVAGEKQRQEMVVAVGVWLAK